jgi:hypothetical protein
VKIEPMGGDAKMGEAQRQLDAVKIETQRRRGQYQPAGQGQLGATENERRDQNKEAARRRRTLNHEQEVWCM